MNTKKEIPIFKFQIPIKKIILNKKKLQIPIVSLEFGILYFLEFQY
jgi:hypothetical protein